VRSPVRLMAIEMEYISSTLIRFDHL